MAEDEHLHVEFYMGSRRNKAKTAEAGRPIYDDLELVRIRFVGDRKKDLHAPAHEKFAASEEHGGHITYAERFSTEYEAFKRGEEVRRNGTPLASAGFLTAGKIKELEAMHIFTIDALAGAKADSLGFGGQKLIDQANDFLASAATTAAVHEKDAEIEALKARLAALESGGEAPQGAASGTADGDPENWTDEKLREVAAGHGIKVRANSNRENLITAVKNLMAEAA